ncbi:hypothetical protein CCP2SC5_2690002 [Azospirillaceae bacterium]
MRQEQERSDISIDKNTRVDAGFVAFPLAIGRVTNLNFMTWLWMRRFHPCRTPFSRRVFFLINTHDIR